MTNFSKGEWKPSAFSIYVGERRILDAVIGDGKSSPLPIPEIQANLELCAAAPEMYLAGQGLDSAIGSAIIEIARVATFNEPLLNIINTYILPAQENWRKALAKASGGRP